MTNRASTIEGFQLNPSVSVLIIGGGVNGCGLFRELALQGVDVLLVEKDDFCSAASAASTRVIHGGLRYLENREIRLVKESLSERNRLLRNAPHYVRPLPTTIPIFGWFDGLISGAANFFGIPRKPQDRGALVVKIGLSLYDYFAGRSGMPRHHFDSRRAALNKRPHLAPDIVATATYYDARILYPERLCLELVQDAESAHEGAHGLNYMRLVSGDQDTVTLEDTLTNEHLTIKPNIVVNATGAWIDFTNRNLQKPSSLIGGTKGSHLVVDHAQLFEATQGEMLYFANADGRICIFYPFFDKVIVGSTDIPVEDPEMAVCDDTEVDYLLESVRQVFPSITIDRSDIVYQFCGVRPLPASSALTAGQISRDHQCQIMPPDATISFPIYSLVGGKWTTFRAFAQQVTDTILATLHLSRRIDTQDIPIGGGRAYPQSDAERKNWLRQQRDQTGLSHDHLQTLFTRYGTRAEAVAKFISQDADRPLIGLDDYSLREIQFLAGNEMVEHLDDVVLRRTLIGFLGQLTPELLTELAQVVARVKGWSNGHMQAEMDRVSDLLMTRHGTKLV